MKIKLYKLYTFLVIGLCSWQGAIGQTTIAYWSFDDSDLYIDGGSFDNQGKMIQNSAAGAYTFPAGAGSSGYAVSSNKWDGGYGVWAVATYDYYYDPIVTTGYGCLTISSVQRSSATGPKNFTMEYSFDSWTWYTVPNASVITVGNDYTKGVVNNVSLPSVCDNQPMVFIRWAMTDLEAVGGGSVAATGTSRIDEIVINGYAVPDPAGFISGLISVSQGQNGVTYTVPPIANATSYNWYLPPGASIVSGNNTNSITVNFSGTASTGNVSVEGVNACGSGVISDLLVTVNTGIAQPVITPLGPTSFCEGSSVTLQSSAADTYLWSNGESTQSITISGLSAGTYNYSVNVTIGGQSATSLTEMIQVDPLPQTNAGSDVSYCTGDSIAIGSTAIPGNTYSWLPANDLSNAAVSNPYVHASNGTSSPLVLNYVLTETISASGCSNTDNVQVTVYPKPIAMAGSDVSFCSGGSAGLGKPSTPGITYVWSPSSGLDNQSLSNPDVSLNNVGSSPLVMNYVISVTSNTGGCSNTDTVQVTVNPLPLADAGSTVTINAGDSVMLQASGGTSYSWSPAGSLSNAGIDTPYAQPSSTTLYTVVVSDVNSCMATDTVSVIVNISTDVSLMKSGDTQIQLFPNPMTSSLQIQFTNDGKQHDYTFVLYDVLGNRVREYAHIRQNSFVMMRDDLASGMYFFKVFEGRVECFGGKVVVR